MVTWTNYVTTGSGGNVTLAIEGGYGTVTRNGNTVSFDYGIRFESGPDYYTCNSIGAKYNDSWYYAFKGNNSAYTTSWQWLYATTTSPGSGSKYTTEVTPFHYSGTVSGTGSGSITISIGTAWNYFTLVNSAYTYSFTVPYAAAASCTVSYNANGGSGAPSSQTKYQGYSLTLSSTPPTRTGYAFKEWNTAANGSGTSYAAGSIYTGDAPLSLYAQWTPLNPIFSVPSLTATETSISWSSFTSNISSYFKYSIDNGTTWVNIGSSASTTAQAGTISDLTVGTSYTVIFRAENATLTDLTTDHSATCSTYLYPYISKLSKSSVEAGSSQGFTLYNPLKRSVTVNIDSVNGTSGTYASVSTTGETASLTVPLEASAKKMTNKTSASIVYSCTYSSIVRTTTGTVTIPSSAAPTINANKKTSFFSYLDCAQITIDGTTRDMLDITGSNQTLLQGYSKLQYSLVTANDPFSAQYNATITSYSVKINTKTATTTTKGTTYYEGSSGGTTTSGSAVVITANNTYSIEISATDSRGYSNSYTLSIPTYVYSKPKPIISQIKRNDGYGTNATLIISGTWSPNLNGKRLANKIILKYKVSTAESYSSYTLYTDSNVYTPLSGTYDLTNIISFSSTNAYSLCVEAKDGIGNTVTSEVVSLPLGTPIMMIDSVQTGVGINCFPSANGLFVDGVEQHPGAIVGQTSNTATNYWYKVASYISSSTYNDASICFKVSAGFNDNSKKTGILNAHIRSDGSGYWLSGELVWESAGTGINPSYFILAHNSSPNTVIAEIWCYCPSAWQQIHFDVLTTGSRTDRFKKEWILYNNVSADGAASPTSGYTQITSVLDNPRIFYGTGSPSGGANGDIYVKYTA